SNRRRLDRTPGLAIAVPIAIQCYRPALSPALIGLLPEVVDVDVPAGEGVGERAAAHRDRPVAAVVPTARDRIGEPADRDVSGPGAAAGGDHPDVRLTPAAAADLGIRVVGVHPRPRLGSDQGRVEPP